MADLGLSVLLGITNTEQLKQFLHSSVDNLVGKTGTCFETINSDIDWSKDDYKTARKFVQNFYKNIIINNSYNINTELVELGSEKIDCIRRCFEIRKPEIQRAVTNEYLAKMNVAVTDFDWKLKWVIGSSALSSLREPIMQMDLETKKIDQEENEVNDRVKFEMNIGELKSFIAGAEKCLEDFKH